MDSFYNANQQVQPKQTTRFPETLMLWMKQLDHECYLGLEFVKFRKVKKHWNHPLPDVCSRKVRYFSPLFFFVNKCLTTTLPITKPKPFLKSLLIQPTFTALWYNGGILSNRISLHSKCFEEIHFYRAKAIFYQFAQILNASGWCWMPKLTVEAGSSK